MTICHFNLNQVGHLLLSRKRLIMKIKNNTVYLCKTHALARQFLQECEEQGYLWISDKKPTQDYVWEVYEKVAFYITNGYLQFGAMNSVDEDNEDRLPVIEYKPNAKQTIVIKTDGNTVTAYMGDKRGVAKCNPVDTFDLYTGAKLALDRLFDKDERTEQVQEHFVPYLIAENTKCHYGIIGTPTKYRDITGKLLFVGDVVDLYWGGEKIITTCVVQDQDITKQFVMGIEMRCDDKKGRITDGWKVLKTRGYDEVDDGESVYCIKYIKSKK